MIDYINGRADVFMYGMRHVYFFAGLICTIGSIITAIRFYNSKKSKDNPEIEEMYRASETK